MAKDTVNIGLDMPQNGQKRWFLIHIFLFLNRATKPLFLCIFYLSLLLALFLS